MQNKEFLGTEPIGRLLFRLAIPTVSAQLINMLYNIVDRIYIGHMPGDGSLALTGVGVCMPLIMIISAFAAFISSGSAPRASIHMGRCEHDTAERILGSSLALQLILSAVLTAALLAFNRRLLLAFGASENTIVYASGYTSIYALGTVFVQATLGMNAFITAQGFTKTGMLTVLVGAVSNIILDPLLIYVLGMGVRGAALATIISQCLSAVWCVSFLSGKKSLLKLRPEFIRPDLKLLAPCLALGSATFIMISSESVISVCFNSSLLRYGGDIAVGAMTLCSSVMQFSLLPMQGIGQAAQPISGYNFGAGNVLRVKRTFKLLLISCLCFSTVMWAAIMLFPGVFAGIFTSDPALIEFSSQVMRIYFAVMFIFGIQIACQMTFVSTGNAVCSIIVAIVRKFILLLPMIYIVPALVRDKVSGVFLAEPVSDLIAVTFTVILFSIQFRNAMKELEAAGRR